MGGPTLKKILILEDNPLALEHLSNIVCDLGANNVVYGYSNIRDAYQCAMERTIDLFLIDIILDMGRPGDASGLRFVENIRQVEYYNFTPIIFVTSLEDAKAYTYEKLHCYRFIEKPFDVEQVKRTIKQCLKFPGNMKETKTLYFRKDGIILAVERDDIVYAESMEHIMHIHTKQGDILKIPYITLKKLLDDLDSPDMLQCSRNTIVNRNYVHNVDIPNRMIQFKDDLGRAEIGIVFKKYVKECFS